VAASRPVDITDHVAAGVARARPKGGRSTGHASRGARGIPYRAGEAREAVHGDGQAGAWVVPDARSAEGTVSLVNMRARSVPERAGTRGRDQLER